MKQQLLLQLFLVLNIDDKHQQHYMENPIDKPNFIQILTKLSGGIFMEICTVDDFMEAYEHIKNTQHQVFIKDIYQFATCIFKKYSELLLRDLSYCEQVLYKILQDGIKNIKLEQLSSLLDNGQFKTGVTHKMLASIKPCNYISVEKVLKVIDHSRVIHEKSERINLFEQSIDVQATFTMYQKYHQQPLIALYQHCMSNISDNAFLEKFKQIYHQVEQLYKNTHQQLNQSKKYTKDLQNEISKLQNQLCKQLNYINQQAQKLTEMNIMLYQQTNEKQKLHIQILQMQEEMHILTEQNKLLNAQFNQMTHKLKTKQSEIFENSFKMQEEIFLNVQKVSTRQTEQNQPAYNEQHSKFDQPDDVIVNNHINSGKSYINQSFCEKLQSANKKISALQEQNKHLQHIIDDVQAASVARIHNLQQQISQNKIIRDNMIKNIENFSISSYNSRIYESSLKESYIHSKINRDLKQDTNKSMFQKYNQGLIAHGQTSEISSSVQFYEEDYITKYDFLGLSKQKQIGDLTSMLSKLSKQQKKVNGIFTSQAHLVKEAGAFVDICIALSSRKFSLLDAKFRQRQSYYISELSKIIVCQHNQHLLLLKFKTKFCQNTNKTFSNSHSTKQFLLHLYTRNDFLNYLKSRCAKYFKQAIFIIEPEQKIQMKVANKTFPITNYQQIFNPFWISLSQQKSVFEVQIQEKGLLSLWYSAILIIQPIGCIFLQKEKYNQIQNKQRLLYWLPLIEDMKIYQENSQKVYFSYKYFKKQFIIHAMSVVLAQKIICECEQIRQKNRYLKQERYHKTSQILKSKEGIQ